MPVPPICVQLEQSQLFQSNFALPNKASCCHHKLDGRQLVEAEDVSLVQSAVSGVQAEWRQHSANTRAHDTQVNS